MYSSVTLLFPGQGAQYVGMGKSLQGHDYSLFEKADQVLGYSLSQICFDGPEEKLKLTENTQPAILTYSVALFKKVRDILTEKNIKIDRVLGHSVGEYAALVASGVLSFEDAVKAVHLRGKFMQMAAPEGKGGMFAIMRSSEEFVKKACQEASSGDSVVSPANFNEPGQTVISGDLDACRRAVKWVEENAESKRVKALELKVSAPFHCQLMKPAEENLAKVFEEIHFSEVKTPYIANIDAKEYGVGTSPEVVRANLLKQVCGTVLWSQSMQLISDNSLCLELGPGRVLSGLSRKINRNINVISMDNERAFDELREALS